MSYSQRLQYDDTEHETLYYWDAEVMARLLNVGFLRLESERMLVMTGRNRTKQLTQTKTAGHSFKVT